jgi:hypothetical protein
MGGCLGLADSSATPRAEAACSLSAARSTAASNAGCVFRILSIGRWYGISMLIDPLFHGGLRVKFSYPSLRGLFDECRCQTQCQSYREICNHELTVIETPSAAK